MRKKAVIAATVVIMLVVLSRPELTNVLIMFLLTGAIPGTPFSVPFWLMMAVYCSVIALTLTWYLEPFISAANQSRVTHARKSRMPRRRYSHS